MNETSLTTTNDINWKLPLALTTAAIVYLLLLYFPTTESTVSIWIRSDTFAHGFLIFPISIWLIWQRRKEISFLSPQPINWPAAGILVVSFGWLLAYYVDVLVVQQLALVALIPIVVFILLGWEVTKALSFPLFFLIFAVPMGEGLVPSLIDFTADFTVAMVKMVGIPIYREGTYFELPTGNWSVVEACSGVRYLIASVTLGFLYAYMTYQTLWKRTAFVAVSVIVPIFANGLRAFMIVMIGHFSDMQLATGVDHLIYGWVFFGIVIAIMFYIGSYWREDRVEINSDSIVSGNGNGSFDQKKMFASFGLVLIMLSVAPLMAYSESDLTKEELDIKLSVPASTKWTAADQQLTEWKPHYLGVDAEVQQTYAASDRQVSLYVGYYVKQRQGAELITSTNLLVGNEDKNWRSINKGTLKTDAGAIPMAIVKSGVEEYLVAYYYVVDGKITTNPYITKLHEAKARLLGGDKSASIVSVATPVGEHPEKAEQVLIDFLQDMQASIRNTIQQPVKK